MLRYGPGLIVLRGRAVLSRLSGKRVVVVSEEKVLCRISRLLVPVLADFPGEDLQVARNPRVNVIQHSQGIHPDRWFHDHAAVGNLDHLVATGIRPADELRPVHRHHPDVRRPADDRKLGGCSGAALVHADVDLVLEEMEALLLREVVGSDLGPGILVAVAELVGDLARIGRRARKREEGDREKEQALHEAR